MYSEERNRMFTYTIHTEAPRGYTITDGIQTLHWDVPGTHVLPQVINPPQGEDDGTDQWLINMAEAACTMFNGITPQNPADKRAEAYAEEADPLLAAANSYRAEADAWALEGNDEESAAAGAKADAKLKEYLAKKQEIRARYPDEEQA
jgi:hypothetical protein